MGGGGCRVQAGEAIAKRSPCCTCPRPSTGRCSPMTNASRQAPRADVALTSPGEKYAEDSQTSDSPARNRPPSRARPRPLLLRRPPLAGHPAEHRAGRPSHGRARSRPSQGPPSAPPRGSHPAWFPIGLSSSPVPTTAWLSAAAPGRGAAVRGCPPASAAGDSDCARRMRTMMQDARSMSLIFPAGQFQMLGTIFRGQLTAMWSCRWLPRWNAGRCSEVKGSLACPVFASI